MEKKIIRVTAQDITDGLRGSVGGCPIALAARRQGMERFVISKDIFGWETMRFIGKTPPAARRFIAAFDDRKPVRPFRFQIQYRRNK